MNLSLLDPFSLAQDYPETLSKRLSEYACRNHARYANHMQFQKLTQNGDTRVAFRLIERETTLHRGLWMAQL